MRYYDIKFTNPATGADILPSSLGGLGLTSLLPNGQTNVAALNVQFDLPIASFTDPDSNAWLCIWGLSLKDIGAAFNLNGADVTISAGMAKGLPLAKPQQRGLIVKGQVYQAFGNWVGTEQTVQINLTVGGGSSATPGNFPFTWKQGTPLSTAIGQTLSTAMPTYKQDIRISSSLVLGHDETGFYQSLSALAQWINQKSVDIIGGTYGGVTIATDGQTVTVADGTQPPKNGPVAIAFEDMIGQPTWIDPATISVTLVLRGDISVLDEVTLPPSAQTVTAQSLQRFQDNSLFNGTFTVLQVHHYGNFRQPDAGSWATVIQITPTPKAASTTPAQSPNNNPNRA